MLSTYTKLNKNSMCDIKPIVKNQTLSKHCCVTTSSPQRNNKISAVKKDRSMDSKIWREDMHTVQTSISFFFSNNYLIKGAKGNKHHLNKLPISCSLLQQVIKLCFHRCTNMASSQVILTNITPPKNN